MKKRAASPRPDEFKIPFTDLKNSVLGNKYELSLVFADNALSRHLNKTYRGKDHPTNVLSFPISETSGEIFIALEIAKKEAPKFDMNFEKFVTYLFIHGLLHLKGMEHGDTMDRLEQKLLHGASNSSRHRHRNFRSESGRRGRNLRT